MVSFISYLHGAQTSAVVHYVFLLCFKISYWTFCAKLRHKANCIPRSLDLVECIQCHAVSQVIFHILYSHQKFTKDG